jgi:hypothetical protein
LPLGDDPVLDAQPLATVKVGPAGNVAGRVDAGRAGFEVFIVAPEARPMERVVGPALGDFVRSLHEAHGVVFHLGHTLAAIEADRVRLDDGASLDTELVVVGIGVRPRVGLAHDAGLAIDGGVLVGASSALTTVTPPPNPSRRSISAAAKPRRPAADNNDALGRSAGRPRSRQHARFGRRHLLMDEDAPVTAVDAPARIRGQCRRR